MNKLTVDWQKVRDKFCVQNMSLTMELTKLQTPLLVVQASRDCGLWRQSE